MKKLNKNEMFTVNGGGENWDPNFSQDCDFNGFGMASNQCVDTAPRPQTIGS